MLLVVTVMVTTCNTFAVKARFISMFEKFMRVVQQLEGVMSTAGKAISLGFIASIGGLRKFEVGRICQKKDSYFIIYSKQIT